MALDSFTWAVRHRPKLPLLIIVRYFLAGDMIGKRFSASKLQMLVTNLPPRKV